MASSWTDSGLPTTRYPARSSAEDIEGARDVLSGGRQFGRCSVHVSLPVCLLVPARLRMRGSTCEGQICPVGTVIPRRRCYNTHRGLGCSEPVDQVVQCQHSSESTRQDSCARSVGVLGAWDTSDDVQGRCCRRIWQPGESLRRPHLVGPE
jgi:hypothetical protein